MKFGVPGRPHDGRWMGDVVYGGAFSTGNQERRDMVVGGAINSQTASPSPTMTLLRSSIALSTAPVEDVAWGCHQFGPLVLSGLGGRANWPSPGTINICLFKTLALHRAC